MSTEKNKECEACGSTEFKEEVKPFELDDNVLKISKCVNCGLEKSNVVHIG
jgi:uncharacterized Zn finger protein